MAPEQISGGVVKKASKVTLWVTLSPLPGPKGPGPFDAPHQSFEASNKVSELSIPLPKPAGVTPITLFFMIQLPEIEPCPPKSSNRAPPPPETLPAKTLFRISTVPLLKIPPPVVLSP